jgi:hypothetical protein
MSEAGYVRDEHYRFLLSEFPGNTVHARFKTLFFEVKRIVRTGRLESSVRIDEESLQMAVIDYFTDISRLKEFQAIKKANVNKIYGYALYWFLRRHPVQIVMPTPENFDINEKVALAVFLPKILVEAGMPYTKSKPQEEVFRARLNSFANLLFYNFKYRVYTQQSLELAIEAFLCGCFSMKHHSVT